ncbi:MAG: IS66 family insertion sequence element accessory protein TnpA [Candidatus Dormibacteraceae bacterium]
MWSGEGSAQNARIIRDLARSSPPIIETQTGNLGCLSGKARPTIRELRVSVASLHGKRPFFARLTRQWLGAIFARRIWAVEESRMSRVPVELREQVLKYWRGHPEPWKLSGLTQKEYCEQHNLSLKNFGNWRAQLKRVALMGSDARWGHYPRLRRTLADLSPRAKPGVNPRVKAPVPATVRSPWQASGVL